MTGNFGLNSQLKASQDKPVSLYDSDFDGNGSLDPILCSYIENESYPVFSKDDLLGQLNKLKGRYVNYVDYADEKITDIFTPDQLKEARVLETKNFETSHMENLGEGRFQLSPLPKETQFSPIYGMVAKDFDRDGNLDLLLTGNFFGTRVKYGRYDANKGLLLLGDGKGSFKAVNNLESGLQLAGEIRDIAVVRQGVLDQLMVFAQNNGPLQIYKINQPFKK